MGKFDGKVVIITGASAGIGQDGAVEFGKAGASVVIHGQNVDRLNQTEDLLLAAGVPNDTILKVIGSMEDECTPNKIIDEAMKKFGKIDVLINNAGAILKPNTDGDALGNLDFIFRVNFRSVIQLTQLAMPYLEKTKGNIVNVSSAGAVRAFPTATFYCSLKSALDHFTRCYAQICGPKGVRINCLNPGPVQTMIMDRHGRTPDVQDKHMKWIESTTLLQRVGLPAEMSTILLFLASEDAAYVTGASWLADGGHSLFTPSIDFT